jgi:hypothetical protein
METDSRDLDIIEDLCRLDRERELSASSNLDVCELIVQSRSASESRREWVPASDWSDSLPKLG